MKRRSVLFGAGAVLSLGLAGRRARPPPDKLRIKVWLTDGAAAHPACRERAAEYIRQALAPTDHDIELSYGESTLQFEASDRRVEREAWPRRVLEGVAGAGAIAPVRDVNLLVTDGTVTGSTVGYAYDHVAAVPGARFLAEVAPAEETPSVVDYSVPAAVTQLLVHEVGHALGLAHSHGSVTVDDSTITASPMVSGYAWAPDEVRTGQLGTLECGGRGSKVQHRQRRLSMQFSACAERALRSYRGGLFS